MVRSREMAAQLRFWTAIVGYDPRDRSTNQKIYLVYLVIFFSLWGIAVLALFADLGSLGLALVPGLSPQIAGVLVITTWLVAEAVLRGYASTKSSPFVFSQEDATQICQTPIDRRHVALIELFMDWLPAVIPILILSVVLVIASLQIAEGGRVAWKELPFYWMVSIRMAIIVLPLHLSLMALDYALGALRLRGGQDIPAIHWIALSFGLILISLALFNRKALELLLWPVIYPIQSGFSGDNWVVGIILVLLLALAGVLLLYWFSPRLNLSRAAQESRFRGVSRQLSLLGDSRLTRQLKAQERLGIGHSPSRIPGLPGPWSLVWKY